MDGRQRHERDDQAAMASAMPLSRTDNQPELQEAQMRKYIVVIACSAGLMMAAPASAWATGSPATGQPGAPANTCGTDNPVMPGSSATATGSPLNASGRGGGVHAAYPGTPSLANANSTEAASAHDA